MRLRSPDGPGKKGKLAVKAGGPGSGVTTAARSLDGDLLSHGNYLQLKVNCLDSRIQDGHHRLRYEARG